MLPKSSYRDQAQPDVEVKQRIVEEGEDRLLQPGNTTV